MKIFGRKRFLLSMLLFSMTQWLATGQSVLTNQYDSLGCRTGLWVYETSYGVNYENYINGKLDGLCYYYQNGELIYLCYESKGKMIWSQMYSSNHPVIINTDYEHKMIEMPNTQGYMSYFSVIYYSRQFDENGRIEEEGYIVSKDDQDFIMDVQQYGEWKYYATDGTVAYTKMFDKTDYEY